MLSKQEISSTKQMLLPNKWNSETKPNKRIFWPNKVTTDLSKQTNVK